MRRHDDGRAPRQAGAAPFRVLATTESPYLSVTPTVAAPPPPPRAPEPYKVAPASSSYGRAHRRSSFVIIAETRPATPDSGSPSPPPLSTGRASPFRGRGFKGPPPRSRSRPRSPETIDGRRRGRNDRGVSLSQQNSPRRSLIPQPTRRRSTSLGKANDTSPSPPIGRRVDSRNRLNVSDSKSRLNSSDSRTRLNVTDSRNRLNQADSRTRLNTYESKYRSSIANGSNTNANNNVGNFSARRLPFGQASKLSPIQGTPTKPDKAVSQHVRRDRSKEAPRFSPTKTSRYAGSPPKSVSSVRKSTQEKYSNKDRQSSPSKIPLKTGKFGSTSSLNANRFISMPSQEKTSNRRNEKDGKQAGNGSDQSANSTGKDARRSDLNSTGSDKSPADKNSASIDKPGGAALLHLLKQSSGATGTSSVVNTTTTTAVQPLHIDANAVLVDRDFGDKRSNLYDQARRQASNSASKSSNSPASRDESPVVMYAHNGQSSGHKDVRSNDSERPTNAQATAMPGKVAGSQQRARNAAGDGTVDSPAGTDSAGGHSKNSSVGQSAKNANRTNGTANGNGSANSRPGARKNGTTWNDQTSNASSARTSDRNARMDAQKGGEDLSMKSSTSLTDGGRTNGEQNSEARKTAKPSSVSGTMEDRNSRNVSRTVEVDAGTTTPGVVANATASTATAITTAAATKTNGVPVNSVAGAVNVPGGVNSGRARTRNENRDSNVSLRSSTGTSIGSIESARSTDTGVSVDTVRGVSSPREKTGMHVVKRPQEIETLSGNVMHLEHNGEPAVLAGADEERVPEKLLTRWRKSLDRYCKRCPGMRCLACRRDPKGAPWARNQATAAMQDQTASTAAPVESTDVGPTGCWSKFKTRCKCKRLRDAKCCVRRARIAPAEATVCCPPERRFGAICRRIFSSCKCKRADTERTRNIRAKHSLTSVAPPPVSEEPKAKIPDVLVEHNSLMRGAIPCLPVPLAWFCLVWNVLLPGSGTVWSGLFNLCAGQPRFSAVAGLKSRLGAFIVNLLVGVGQLFTVLFCLVGWGWSIWWGVMMIRLARKYKRFKASEAANGDPEARVGEPAALPPGVPSHALRGLERAR